MAIGLRTNVYKPPTEPQIATAVNEISTTAGGEIGTISVIGTFLGDD